ncbi:MAG TPA: TAXI family TRAP transporter solute-binding subunit [Burkholderiales bacterium]|nr:TAXI family TRAP transporter solute-binding subunit [Burkholderiales bacterium]
MENSPDKWRQSWLRRRSINYVSLRDMAVASWPVLLIVAATLLIAWHFVQPAPPTELIMAAGSEDGAYYGFAKRYREILARDGVNLVLRKTPGSIENLRSLNDENSDIDAAFVQGGIGTADDNPNVESIGSLFYEPVWVFYRSARPLDRLTELRGMRIAVGPENSGTRILAIALLAANGIRVSDVALSDLSGRKATQALQQRAVDAVFFVAAAEAWSVRDALRDSHIKLMNFTRAQAYTRRFSYLSEVVLPRGAIDLARDIPAQDVHLLATTANLLTRWDLHPTLVGLLAAAATEVHGDAGLFQREGDFPSTRHQDYPVNAEAARYYKSGPSFLQRYLPYRVAILIDRLIVLVLPLVVISIPLVRLLPPLYRWRVNSRIYRNYGELRMLEDEIERSPLPEKFPAYIERLDQIEQRVNRLSVPLAFNNALYTLRQHIDYVRTRIAILGTRGQQQEESHHA